MFIIIHTISPFLVRAVHRNTHRKLSGSSIWKDIMTGKKDTWTFMFKK